MGGTVAGRVGLAVVLAAALLAGGGAAQAEDPAWADDLLAELEGAAEAYNARDDRDEGGLLERWLLRNARVNLYVTGPDGATAAYSFRVDERFRVTDLRRGARPEPTLRVTTSRETVAALVAARDTPAAVHRNVRNGRIRVQRVVGLLGLWIAVGVPEVALGAGGMTALALAGTRFGSGSLLSTTRSGIRGAIAALGRAVRSLWRALGQIAAGLTILDQLGLLDRLRERVARWWSAIRDRDDATSGCDAEERE